VPLEREPYVLETSVPGVFVAGDVRARSIKRVASAVGEGSMAVSLITNIWWRPEGSDGRRPGHARGAPFGGPVRRLADPELAEWAAVARPYHLGPGEIIHEQGDDPKGLQLLLEGERRR